MKYIFSDIKSLDNSIKPLSSTIVATVNHSTWMLQILGLAVAYLVTGKIGIFLAIPPGYATAIWPPSGIALAGILLYGYRVWPGILLGSMLVNLPTTWDSSSSFDIFISMTIVLAISSGAALQAIVGTYLLRRFGGFPNSLGSEKEVFSFMLFGGILSSLINSTLSVTTLVLSNRIPMTNFLANWGTWWVGDVIGVFIFTPLVLMWTLSPYTDWVNRRKPISLAIVTTFLLTTALVFYASQKESEQLNFEFVREATSFKVTLEKSILMYLDTLRSLESFYSASNTVEREEFDAFVLNSLNSLPGIQALEWSPIITSAKRDSFEKNIRHNGFPNFQITERDGHKHILRANERPEFVPVTFVKPYEGNETALGYDLYSDPIRREALDRARDTGEIAITARITLVQDKGNQFGVLAFMPLYKKNLSHNNTAERRLNITGYVLLVFRGGDIVTASLHNLNTDKLTYQLIDETAPIGEQLLFASGQKELIPFTLNEKGLFGKHLSLISSSSIPIGGRQWRFDIIPTQSFFADHRSFTAWIILLAGLLLSSLVGAFVLVSTGHSALLLRRVEERTTELRQSEERFRTLANSAPVLIWMSGKDRLCVWFNQVWLDFTGHSMDQEIGNGWAEAVHPEDVDHCLDIYVTHFDQRKEFRMEYRLRRHDGEYRWIDDYGVPLIDDQGYFTGYIGSCFDITELKSTEEMLNQLTIEQHAMLDNGLVGIAKIKGHQISWKNQAMAKMFRYEFYELVGMNTCVLFPDESSYQAFYDASYPILNTQGVYRTQILMLRKDRVGIWIDLHGSRLSEESGEFLWILVDITLQKQREEQISALAYHDILTGLPNRQLLSDRLNQAIALAERSHQLLAVCYLDLDGFKPVNDQFGHDAGDKLLIEVARRMQSAVRANDTVSRMGGDEFVLLLSNLERVEDYHIVLQRVIDSINLPIFLDEVNQVTVSASIGVTLFPTDKYDADTLLRHADQAMYQAKKSGRNCVCSYDLSLCGEL